MAVSLGDVAPRRPRPPLDLRRGNQLRVVVEAERGLATLLHDVDLLDPARAFQHRGESPYAGVFGVREFGED